MSQGYEILHMQADSIFGSCGLAVHDRGWSVFPQETNRQPGKVHGKMIAWGGKDNVFPTRATVREWEGYCACLNVAAVMGPTSGGIFALDIDCLDLGRSCQVEDIAIRILGDTEFRRVGMSPKLAMLYRCGVEVKSKAWLFRDGEGDSLEILGAGKPLTMLGKHHKTGDYFKWLGSLNPLSHGPKSAPLVSTDQLRAFVDAVAEVLPFKEMARTEQPAAAMGWSPADANGIRLPMLRQGSWTLDDGGRVSDGRSRFLNSLVWQAANSNPGASAAALCAAVQRAFSESAICSGRWTGPTLLTEIASNVARTIGKLNSIRSI